MSRRREEAELARALALSTQPVASTPALSAVSAARLAAAHFDSSGSGSGSGATRTSQDSKDMELQPVAGVAATAAPPGTIAPADVMRPPSIVPSGSSTTGTSGSAITSFSQHHPQVILPASTATTPSSPILPFSRAVAMPPSSAATPSRPLFSPTQISGGDGGKARDSAATSVAAPSAAAVPAHRKPDSPRPRAYHVSSSPERAEAAPAGASAARVTHPSSLEPRTPAHPAEIATTRPRVRASSVDPLDSLSGLSADTAARRATGDVAPPRSSAVPAAASSASTTTDAGSRRASSRVAEHQAKVDAEKEQRRRLRAERKEREAREAREAIERTGGEGGGSAVPVPVGSAKGKGKGRAAAVPTLVVDLSDRRAAPDQPSSDGIDDIIEVASYVPPEPAPAVTPAAAKDAKDAKDARKRKGDDEDEDDFRPGQRKKKDAKKKVPARKRVVASPAPAPLPKAVELEHEEEEEEMEEPVPVAVQAEKHKSLSLTPEPGSPAKAETVSSTAKVGPSMPTAVTSATAVNVSTPRQRSPLEPVVRNVATPVARPSPGPDNSGIKWKAPRNDLGNLLAKFPGAKAGGMSRRIRIAPLHASIGAPAKPKAALPGKKTRKVEEDEEDEYEGLDEAEVESLKRKKELEWIMMED